MRCVCSICSELFSTSTDISAALCGHVFHYTCLTQWIAKSETCPQCRKIVSKNNVIPKLYFEDEAGDEANFETRHDQVTTLTEKLKQTDLQVTHLYEVIDSMLLSDMEKERTIGTLKTELNHTKTVIEDLKTEVAHLHSENSKAASYQNDITTLKAKIAQLDNDVVQERQKTASLNLEVVQLKKDLTNERKNVVVLDRHLDHLRIENKKIALYEKEIAALKAELKECKDLQVQTSVDTLENMQAEIDSQDVPCRKQKCRKVNLKSAIKRHKPASSHTSVDESSSMSSTVFGVVRKSKRQPSKAAAAAASKTIIISDEDDDSDDWN